MKARRGFTLIELMVVILIVAILAAVAIPIMRGRIDAAKWSEGKAMMGTIGVAIRAYAAEKNDNVLVNALAGLDGSTDGLGVLGILSVDLTGAYFTDPGAFVITACNYNNATNVLTYTITAQSPADIDYPDSVTLTQAGIWTEN